MTECDVQITQPNCNFFGKKEKNVWGNSFIMKRCRAAETPQPENLQVKENMFFWCRLQQKSHNHNYYLFKMIIPTNCTANCNFSQNNHHMVQPRPKWPRVLFCTSVLKCPVAYRYVISAISSYQHRWFIGPAVASSPGWHIWKMLKNVECKHVVLISAFISCCVTVCVSRSLLLRG